jgi:uncharacterized protein with HEPN domain
MLDAAREAVHFAEAKTRDDLDRDRKLALALMKCIEIIGEAAANISNEFKETLPDIPWKSILGTRNRLVHAYFEIDINVVWYTTTASPDEGSQTTSKRSVLLSLKFLSCREDF